MTGVRVAASAAIAGAIGASPAKTKSALNAAVRVDVLFAIAPFIPQLVIAA
jgi:hypothetical protein